MKRALFVLLAAACATAPQKTAQPLAPLPAPPKPHATSATALEDRAGDSVESAIDVPATAEQEGVPFENEWIFKRFGRFRRRGGGTGVLNNRRYDVVKIELPNGDQKTVYFDITEVWKRWSPQ